MLKYDWEKYFVEKSVTRSLALFVDVLTYYVETV